MLPKFNYEAPLTFLVWLTSIVSIIATYIVSYFMIPDLGGDTTLWWKLSSVITCGTLAGALIPEPGQDLHFDGIHSRAGSGYFIARGRRVAQYSLRACRGQLQRVLAGFRHAAAHGRGLRAQHSWSGRTDGGSRGVCFRSGGVRIPRYGSGYDRGRFLWAGD